MKKQFSIYLVLAAISLLLQSCLDGDPAEKMNSLAESYRKKEITNSQMLFGMGKIYLENPENEAVKTEYFEKMIISGYAAHILHRYLKEPGASFGEEDMKMILFALQKGNHYNMADKFTARFSDPYRKTLMDLAAVNDSLQHLNSLVKNSPGAEVFEARGRFFRRINATEVANIDLDKSIRMDSCNPGALFEKAVILFNNEKTGEVAGLLERCRSNVESGQYAWYPVFSKLAKEIEELKNLSLPENELLFRQANLYVNSGFSELALRKSDSLLKADGNSNPDYMALHGFILYKMNKKEEAMKYVTEAERISGRKSKLSEMIAQMD